MNTSTLEIEKESSLAWLKLSRPTAANSLNREILLAIRAACEELAKDKSIRVLSIIGAGTKVFCAGADLKERHKLEPLEVREYISLIQNTMLAIESFPQPVIAAINGSAFGGGVELILACDLRVMVSGATLALTEVKLGIIPGGGGTQRLPRLIGKSKAKEMIYTGAVVTAEECFRLGLINRLVTVPAKSGAAFHGPLMEEVRNFALEIASGAPLALEQAKVAIDSGYDQDLKVALALETESYMRLINTKDRLEGLNAFSEKRAPQYKGE